MEKGKITTEVINNIATITFMHPAGNSFPSYLLKELQLHIEKADADTAVKVIVLQSAGRAFCGGASFSELITLDNLQDAKSFFMGFARVINTMRKTSKFIIAKVQGKAVGGGVGLIAASDYAIATDAAAVKLSELSIGIGPYVIAPAVKRKIGIAAFSELSINATQWHTAFWAREKGLYAQVTDNEKELQNEVEILTGKLSKYDSNATALLKKEIWKGTDNWDELLEKQAELSARLVLQDFTKEVLQKFKK